MLPAALCGLAATTPRGPVKAGSSDVAGSDLRDRLERATEAEQERLLFELVRKETAAVLGHESPEGVDMELGFLEQGLDSVAAVMFRNRLCAITRLRLPSTVIFDYPTPAILARQLRLELSAAGVLPGQDRPQVGLGRRPNGRRYVASADTRTKGNGEPVNSLGQLYEQAARTGRTDEIMTLIKGLAAFRPAFSSQAELDNVPPPVPVSPGPGTPGLICFPSFVGRSGGQEYVRFAGGFRGLRRVLVVPAPGFTDGEPLAASLDALVGVHAENVRKSANGLPFVLAGHSSGGLVAHAVATRLEAIGVQPAAIVLMDPYLPERRDIAARYSGPVNDRMLADIEHGEDAWLLAMAHYFSF